MLVISFIALSLLGQPGGEIGWMDFPVPPVDEKAPLVARVFEIPKEPAKQLAELIKKLLGDSVKTAVLGDRLVVLADPGKLEFITAIGKEVLGPLSPSGEGSPPPASKAPPPLPRRPRIPPFPLNGPATVETPPEEATALRAAVMDSLEGLFYQSFPASQASFYSSTGGIEVRQSMDLKPASLDALVQFIARVKERMKTAEVVQFHATRNARYAAGEGEWTAKVDFSVLAGKADAAASPPPLFFSFPEAFGALRKALESAGTLESVRSLDLRLRLKNSVSASGEAYRIEDSTILLVLPASTDPFRIEKALNEKSGPFTAKMSVNADREAQRIAVTLRPSREALKRLETK